VDPRGERAVITVERWNSAGCRARSTRSGTGSTPGCSTSRPRSSASWSAAWAQRGSAPAHRDPVPVECRRSRRRSRRRGRRRGGRVGEARVTELKLPVNRVLLSGRLTRDGRSLRGRRHPGDAARPRVPPAVPEPQGTASGRRATSRC
jgi:hypothetical protein